MQEKSLTKKLEILSQLKKIVFHLYTLTFN